MLVRYEFTMSIRVGFFSLAVAMAFQQAYADDLKPAPDPGLVGKVMNTLHCARSKDDNSGVVRTKNLWLAMEISPPHFKLSETRMLKVVLSLTNKSAKMVNLEFPTTQRFEILVRDKSGRQLVQWSEDESFISEQTFITINPREHIEYQAAIPTRDMTAGREFVVEGFFLNYKDLKIRKSIVPEL